MRINKYGYSLVYDNMIHYWCSLCHKEIGSYANRKDERKFAPVKSHL